MGLANSHSYLSRMTLSRVFTTDKRADYTHDSQIHNKANEFKSSAQGFITDGKMQKVPNTSFNLL